jgi:hypothetical protein
MMPNHNGRHERERWEVSVEGGRVLDLRVCERRRRVSSIMSGERTAA